MPSPPETEWPLPCLLDLLTLDETASEKSYRQGGRPDRPTRDELVSETSYREGVKRDLIWLLNAKRHPPGAGLAAFPAVERSGYNLGLRDPAGRTITQAEIKALEREITEAILRYEPRLMPGTLEVSAVTDSKSVAGSPNTLSFEIKADLWAGQTPQSFYVKTFVDLETGKCAA